MKLTTKGRYAVMALADLANFSDQNPVSLRDISLRQGISLDYLEQIFSKLKKDDIVKSIRGKNGGYILAKEPARIKLSNIFSAVDEKVKTLLCKRESKKDVITSQQSALRTIFGMISKCISMIFLIKKILEIL